MDASSFHWIEKEVWHLHVAIDDADGKIVGAYFDYQETLKGYYNVLHQILTNHGIPALFYTDRRTVFEYKKKNRLDAEDIHSAPRPIIIGNRYKNYERTPSKRESRKTQPDAPVTITSRTKAHSYHQHRGRQMNFKLLHKNSMTQFAH